MPNDLNRRDVMKGGTVVFFSGAISALETFLTGCASRASSISSTSVDASASCVASTNVTRGPYFVDNQSDPYISNDIVDSSIPERSDIRSDTKGSTGTQGGLPLTLTITVGSYTNGACSPIANAQVHIWHCNAQGVYSDVEAGSNDDGANLTGENFLRGYQYTDSNGKANFTTIYPGWYSGRAVHIHVNIRLFDSSGNVTTEATTQLFFDDSVSTAVYAANASYSRSSTRNTMNTDDSVYTSESPALLLGLNGSDSTSYAGSVSIGITPGTIYGG